MRIRVQRTKVRLTQPVTTHSTSSVPRFPEKVVVSRKLNLPNVLYRSHSSFKIASKASALTTSSPLLPNKPNEVRYSPHLEGNTEEKGEETRRLDVRLTPCKPISRTLVPIRLRNLGNTCFLNAALNGFFSLDRIRLFFSRNFFDSETIASALRQLFEGSECIEVFIKRLRRKLGDLVDGRQHCAHSFLLRLLSTLDQELPSNFPSTSAIQAKDSVIQRYRLNKCAELHDKLSVLTENLFICQKCAYLAFRNYSYSRTLDLPVPISYKKTDFGVEFGPGNFFLSESHTKYRSSRDTKGYLEYFLQNKDQSGRFSPSKGRSVVTCFQYLLRATLMTPGNEFFCEQCKCDTQHYKQSFLRHISPALILHFQLFDESTSGKLRIDIKFDLCLDLSPFLVSAGVYDLKAVVYHMGSLHFGHYMASIRLGERWFSCDDDRVREVAGPETENAYLLIYERRSD